MERNIKVIENSVFGMVIAEMQKKFDYIPYVTNSNLIKYYYNNSKNVRECKEFKLEKIMYKFEIDSSYKDVIGIQAIGMHIEKFMKTFQNKFIIIQNVHIRTEIIKDYLIIILKIIGNISNNKEIKKLFAKSYIKETNFNKEMKCYSLYGQVIKVMKGENTGLEHLSKTLWRKRMDSTLTDHIDLEKNLYQF